MVLFGTGGETHGGSLWRITLHDLINGDIDKVYVALLVCYEALHPSQQFFCHVGTSFQDLRWLL